MTPTHAIRFLRHTSTADYLPEGVTPFVIIQTARTGSNHLAALLDSHPNVICHHEVFNPSGIHRSLSYKNTDINFGTIQERDREPWLFIHRIYDFTDGASAVGFKIGPGRTSTWPMLSLLLNRRVRKVILERRGLLHAFSSALIAKQTLEWSRPKGATAGKRPQVAVRVSLTEFRRFVRRRRVFYGTIKGMLRVTAQHYETLTYEELGDPLALRRVLRFIGVDDQTALASRTERQNSPRLEDRIENYAEICAGLTDRERRLFLERSG